MADRSHPVSIRFTARWKTGRLPRAGRSRQLCVAESATQPTGSPPLRRLDRARNPALSRRRLFFNGLL